MSLYRLVALERTHPVLFDADDDEAAERHARHAACQLPVPPQGRFPTFLLEREDETRWRVVRAWVPEAGIIPLRGYGS
ncbi:hypothetical protein [Blastococcus sp. LR1]|uniref:hypothetical protein n=1 Tax=Blastococcus sp. LR1 TaxID=2877000 RepID=UPI001CCB1017|nr:hypothetical protein [Blastococcus sp. LR1]MCA0143989.1 hypothetical protein [Blastococcus sp. LR1]